MQKTRKPLKNIIVPAAVFFKTKRSKFTKNKTMTVCLYRIFYDVKHKNISKENERRVSRRCWFYKMTELVSRVLYAKRSNHLSSPHVTTRFKPYGSATMKSDGQPAEKSVIKVLLRIGFTASLRYRKLG